MRVCVSVCACVCVCVCVGECEYEYSLCVRVCVSVIRSCLWSVLFVSVQQTLLLRPERFVFVHPLENVMIRTTSRVNQECREVDRNKHVHRVVVADDNGRQEREVHVEEEQSLEEPIALLGVRDEREADDMHASVAGEHEPVALVLGDPPPGGGQVVVREHPFAHGRHRGERGCGDHETAQQNQNSVAEKAL